MRILGCQRPMVLGLVALAACSGPSPAASGGGSGTDDGGDGQGPTATGGADETGTTGGGEDLPHWVTPDRDVDILFVIDDSGSMGEEQAALADSLGKTLELLDLPSLGVGYRIAVTTTDVGNPWCNADTAEQGRFVATSCRSRLADFEPPGLQGSDMVCGGVCDEAWAEIPIAPSPTLDDPTPRPRPWVEWVDHTPNLPAGLTAAEALACILPQGITGCGFESPLEAMRMALERTRDPSAPEYGFVRHDAALLIVFLTDEVDGSTNDGFEAIYDPDGDRVFWSDPTAAAPTSAVSWNAGVACTGTSPYDECHAVDRGLDGSDVDPDVAATEAVLHPVQRYIDYLQAIEDDKQLGAQPREVFVSVIAGFGPNGAVAYADAADPTEQIDFGIGAGCTSAMGRASPPVRLREVAEAFGVGDEVSTHSICSSDYSPAFELLASAIPTQVVPWCVPGCAVDADPTTPALEPICTLTQQEPFADGSVVTTEIPPCTAEQQLPAGAEACWVAVTGDDRADACIDGGGNLELALARADGSNVNGGTVVTADCERTDDGSC